MRLTSEKSRTKATFLYGEVAFTIEEKVKTYKTSSDSSVYVSRKIHVVCPNGTVLFIFHGKYPGIREMRKKTADILLRCERDNINWVNYCTRKQAEIF